MYIFGSEDEDNLETLPEDFIMNIFINAIENILKIKDCEILIKMFRIF